MAGTSYDQFERYRTKGLDARRAGQWESARIYLLEAARAMLELSKSAQGEELQSARREMSAKLLELAKDCATAKTERRTPGGTAARPAASEPQGEAGKDGHQWMVREKPSVRFADVAGLERVKEDIRLKMIYPFQHPELAAKFGVRPGGGVLLYGPPGTGKTLLAKATAGELDAAFFTISPADILSKWVGEAEQNVKKLFDAAAAEPRSVIFIDEVEALIPARTDEGSSVMSRLVPQFLQAMEGFDKKKLSPMLFMGATNVPWQLDPAVLRPGRFDDKVYIPLPDRPGRRTAFAGIVFVAPPGGRRREPAKPWPTRLDGYSGADIKYVCDRAADHPIFAVGRHRRRGGDHGRHPGRHDRNAAPKSVTPEMLRRFERWAAGGGA